MITLDNISYTYNGGTEAVVNASANIGPGVHLLLGENGAGKTTLLHIMSSLLFPTRGHIAINGEDLTERRPSTLGDIFFVSDNMDIPAKTINEFSQLHACFYPRFDREKLAANLADFSMTGNEPFNGLSLGMRHKAVLAYVLSLGVRTLLLDEPANGLDIPSRKTLRSMLARSMDDDSTVIVSTHIVSDFETLYDGIMVLSRGHLLFSLPTWEITRRLSFVTDRFPAADALFVEQDLGVFRSIVAGPADNAGEINIGLLYSAIVSRQGREIVSILTQQSDEQL